MLWALRDSLLPPTDAASGAFVISPLCGRTGVLLAGEADYTVRDVLSAALVALAADGARDIHVDLTELDFMDVCCTRELIAVTERRPAVRLIVYHAPASMRRIIAILHPEADIEFIDTARPGAGEAAGRPGQAASRRPSPAPQEGLLTPDIAELILGEHVRIRKLVGELDSALLDADPVVPGSKPVLAWAALARFLRFHVDAAHEIAYRALAKAVPDAAMAIVQASEADADIRAAVDEAQLSRPGSLAWHLAVEAASDAAKSHVSCLESGPLPHYQHHAAPRQRRVLGRQWVAFMTARVLDASARLRRSRSQCLLQGRRGMGDRHPRQRGADIRHGQVPQRDPPDDREHRAEGVPVDLSCLGGLARQALGQPVGNGGSGR